MLQDRVETQTRLKSTGRLVWFLKVATCTWAYAAHVRADLVRQGVKVRVQIGHIPEYARFESPAEAAWRAERGRQFPECRAHAGVCLCPACRPRLHGARRPAS